VGDISGCCGAGTVFVGGVGVILDSAGISNLSVTGTGVLDCCGATIGLKAIIGLVVGVNGVLFDICKAPTGLVLRCIRLFPDCCEPGSAGAIRTGVFFARSGGTLDVAVDAGVPIA